MKIAVLPAFCAPNSKSPAPERGGTGLYERVAIAQNKTVQGGSRIGQTSRSRGAGFCTQKNLADESGCKPLIRQDAYFFGVIASLPHITYFSELTSPFIVLAFLML